MAKARRSFTYRFQVKRVLSIATFFISVAATADPAGAWWGILEGGAGIAQDPLYDPVPTDPPAVYLVIKGEAAKRMYEKMVGVVVFEGPDSCEEGVITKFSGDLQCAVHVNDQTYVCDIGVDLLKGKSIVGRGC